MTRGQASPPTVRERRSCGLRQTLQPLPHRDWAGGQDQVALLSWHTMTLILFQGWLMLEVNHRAKGCRCGSHHTPPPQRWEEQKERPNADQTVLSGVFTKQSSILRTGNKEEALPLSISPERQSLTCHGRFLS
ncbi:hypothetical protein AAFF_G00186390 [Aldrovandia affinis]|uniref:Uncharacterized protein n=1 Tax=Aldrovandia affinis TaxID=143900 RepID=A0AAD7WVF3_9TELE|nr:hypothetical protein AAFF_G00186390 [Aldrovandia affinis]